MMEQPMNGMDVVLIMLLAYIAHTIVFLRRVSSHERDMQTVAGEEHQALPRFQGGISEKHGMQMN
jgi:hypothetical protein